MTSLLVEDWGEAVTVVAASYTHTGGHDQFTGGVKVAESQFLKVTEVWLRVVELGHLVVVFDDGVQEWGEHGVAIGVTGVHAHAGVGVLTSSPDVVRKSSFEFSS